MRSFLLVLLVIATGAFSSKADNCLAGKPEAIQKRLENELTKIIAQDYAVPGHAPRALSVPRLSLRSTLKLMQNDIQSIHLVVPETLPAMVLAYEGKWTNGNTHPKVIDWKQKRLAEYRWIIVTFKDRSVLVTGITTWGSSLLENTALVQDTVHSPVITVVQPVPNGEWTASLDVTPVTGRFHRVDRLDTYLNEMDGSYELQDLQTKEVREGICLVSNNTIYGFHQAPSLRFK